MFVKSVEKLQFHPTFERKNFKNHYLNVINGYTSKLLFK